MDIGLIQFQIAVVIALIVWPQILTNMLGEGSTENESVHYYLTHSNPNFWEYLENLPNNLFSGKYSNMGFLAIVILLIATMIHVVLHKEEYKGIIHKATLVLVPIIVATLIVMKISCSTATYYICSSYMIIAMLIGGCVAYWFEQVYKLKKVIYYYLV